VIMRIQQVDEHAFSTLCTCCTFTEILAYNCFTIMTSMYVALRNPYGVLLNASWESPLNVQNGVTIFVLLSSRVSPPNGIGRTTQSIIEHVTITQVFRLDVNESNQRNDDNMTRLGSTLPIAKLGAPLCSHFDRIDTKT
jgi:hypothetical protein